MKPATSVRLRNAQLRRQSMMNKLELDIPPSGKGADWIADTAFQIIELLGKQADTYDANNPDDIITVADMIDVLATAHYALTFE